MLASVFGVWWVIDSARQTVPVLTAARTIVPGEVIESDDLTVVDVSLGSAADIYAGPGMLEPGMVATRAIPAGEFVPRASVGVPEDLASTSVVVQSATEIPSTIGPGSVVEVWAAAQHERGVFDTPRLLIAEATVLSVTREDRMLAGAGVSIELVIDRGDVQRALAALSDGSALSVVPGAGE